MFLKIKAAVQVLSLSGAVILSGCIVAPPNNNSHEGTASAHTQYTQQSSGTSEWDRGCADAKSGSYDRSGNAGQDYEQGWKSCQGTGNQSSAPVGQTPPIAQDLVGARAAGAMDDLEKRGLKFVRTTESGGGKDSYWRELGTGGCIVARMMDGKIASATYTSSGDCQ